MNAINTLPSARDRRDFALAELRVERMRQQLVVTEIDLIAAGVQAGFILPDSVPLMLAELYGTAEGAADDGS